MGITNKMLALKASIFLLLLSTGNSLSEMSSCSSGWLDASSAGLGCLLFNSTSKMTWLAANEYCQREDARLIEVGTEAQFNFLKMELDFVDNQVSRHYWWTSGTDIGRGGNWYWTGTLTSVGSFVWSAGQPNEGVGGDCLYLIHSDGYLAGDSACSKSRNAICQIV